jgi:WD40 repeat protein
MSALFISHSSADNALAGEVAARLAEMGHRSVFLDFDPALGIPAGRHWEQELYARLRACQAVIVVCSRHSMASAWCFAEITHARAQGKALFPLKTDDAEITPLLRDLQVIDLTSDRAQAWKRLSAGLVSAGLDPTRLFQWDGSRPPYPGLLAFQKADAAVYFGREAAIQSTLETLNRLQRLAGARMLVVLGASGSGKSSLVRAGVVPRVERDPARWIVAEPFRPLGRPFDMLAMALAGLDTEGDVAAWRGLLERSDVDAAWLEIVDRLQRHSGRREASLLVVVDQFEELLVQADDAASVAFLRMLNAVAARPAAPVLMVATLRSDFLGAFQTHPALQGLNYEPLPLAQIALADLAQVIEGPARVAGIELEPGLAAAMAADTVTEDALPLLAFALREMWDRFGTAGRFLLADYRERLGGLQGALARAAEALCNERTLSPLDLARLHAALLQLVRVGAEGRFVRQPRRWDELPAAVFPLLERFVQARLLVARSEDGARVVEVAHEALFRAWDRLVVWLSADREFLLWRERLHSACAEWRRNGEDTTLLLRGPLLAEAQKWEKDRGDEVDGVSHGFIAASVAARAQHQATREQQRRRMTLAAVGAAGFIAVMAGLAAWQWQQRGQQQRLALARELSAEAAQSDDVLRRMDLTLQSLKQAWTPDAHLLLFEDLARLARPVASRWRPQHGAVLAMALSPDGKWLVTAGQGQLQVQSADGTPRDLHSENHHNTINAVAFSEDGRWLAAACAERKVCVYDTVNWTVAKDWPHDGVISALAFSRDGQWLATGSYQSKLVRLHRVPGWEERARIETGVSLVWSLAFHPDGKRIAVAGQDLELWRIDGAKPTKLYRAQGLSGNWTAFSPDGNDLAVGRRLIEKVGPGPDQKIQQLAGSDNGRCGGFARDGSLIAVCTGSSTGLLVWQHGRPSISTTQPVGAIAFSAGRQIIAGGRDGRIVVWDPQGQALRAFSHADPVHAVAFAPDSRWLATASGQGLLRLFDTSSGSERPALQLGGEIAMLGFSADGRWLAAHAERNLWLIDMNEWRVVAPIVHDAPILRAAFDPDSRHVATITQWEGRVTWVERTNASRQLRVWDIASRAERASAFVFAQDPRRGNFSLEIAKADDDSALAARSITRGDAALTERALAWFARAGGPAPAHSWLQAKTAKDVSLYKAAQEVARHAMNADDNEIRFAFGADGRLMASAADKDVRLWQMKPEDLVADACTRLLRGEGCAP